MNLSIAQTKIVTAPIGEAIQVLASAGSGKTRVLTERIKFILENEPKGGVIALTFTNKAADEMKERLKSIDGADERCWTSTIHGIGQRIIDQYGNTIGLPGDIQIFEREETKKSIFLEALKANNYDLDDFLRIGSFEKDPAKARDRKIHNYIEQFAIVKREMLSDEEIAERYSNDEDFLNVFKVFQSSLLASGGIDFDDILLYAHRILLDQDWVGDIYRAKYRHIFVDEAQDLNKAQYELIKTLCGDKVKSLMMVGDPNQMIYGFNGSSHKYLCDKFPLDFGAKSFTLKENYRSSKAVVRASNKIKVNSQLESEFALNGLFEIIDGLPDERAEADWVTGKVKELLSIGSHEEIEGNISLEKMVVIARNRFVFKALEESLSDSAIHYSLKKSERADDPESLFGQILDLAIRVKLNPKDWVDGKKLFKLFKVKEPSKWGSERVLLDLAKAAKSSTTPLLEIQLDLLKQVDSLDAEDPNIPKLCAHFTKSIEQAKNTNVESELNELEMTASELNEFRSYWTRFKQQGLGESLLAFRNALSLGQLNSDPAQKGLMLSTVHTMKGLEREIVFLIGMCEGVFPDYRATSKKDLEEERNNVYVALTRSKRWLYVTYPKKRLMPWGDERDQQPSRFFRELKES